MYIFNISRCHGNESQIYSVVMATEYIPSSWQQGSHMSHCCGNMPGNISGAFHFWSIACMTSSLYYMQFNKCICNLTSEYSFNCGFNFFDLSDVVYTQVVYITYNMGNRDLPDIYAHALGPAALGLGHIYQVNPSCPCYNLYIYIYIYVYIFVSQCVGGSKSLTGV